MPQIKLSLNSVVAKAPDLLGSSVEGETMLLSIQRGAYFGLAGAGGRIWELLGQPRTVSAMVELLLEEFAVERSACEAQVLEFLQRMADAGLLEVSHGSACQVSAA